MLGTKAPSDDGERTMKSCESGRPVVRRSSRSNIGVVIVQSM